MQREASRKIPLLTDGLGRASLNAASTGTTMVANGIVVQQRKVADDFGQKEKGAPFWVNGEGVSPVPTQACPFGPLALHDWCGIHKTASVYLTDFGLDELQEQF